MLNTTKEENNELATEKSKRLNAKLDQTKIERKRSIVENKNSEEMVATTALQRQTATK